MTWEELADHQLAAARRLSLPERVYPRAACSRAYYACYALLASRAPAGMTFPAGWNNPSHDQLPEIIRSLKHPNQSDIKRNIAELRLAREDAEYRPAVNIGLNRAKDMLRITDEVFRALKGSKTNER